MKFIVLLNLIALLFIQSCNPCHNRSISMRLDASEHRGGNVCDDSLCLFRYHGKLFRKSYTFLIDSKGDIDSVHSFMNPIGKYSMSFAEYQYNLAGIGTDTCSKTRIFLEGSKLFDRCEEYSITGDDIKSDTILIQKGNIVSFYGVVCN